MRGNPAAFPIAITLFAAAVAITNQSLWIDEANSALKVIQPSLASWWHVLVSEKGSELQMPFYMLYLWLWEKIAGHSEFALRAANIPWLLLAHYALWHACRRCAVNPIPLLAIASLNPFLWFYLNEARPYVMQYGAACVLCAFLFETAEDPAHGTQPASLWIFVGGLLLLCGSSLLGVIWAAFAGAAWLFLVRNQFQRLWHWSRLLPLTVGSVCLAGLGVYYLWTIREGGRASDIGRTSLLNLGFVLYELVGAAGLGPGRLELRQHAVAAFRDLGPLLIPFLVGLAISLGLLGYAFGCAWRNRTRRSVIAAAIYAVPPSLLLFVLAYAQNFRILGRHLTPLVPVILGLIVFGISEVRRRRLAAAFLIGLLLVWLGSSLSLRFAPRHRKDDYRAAAGAARDALAHNESVWWSADRAAAVYYGVPLGKSTHGGATLINAFARQQLAGLPAPDVVIASKPDIYDPAGELANFLREHSFARTQDLPAFTIWRRPGAPATR